MKIETKFHGTLDISEEQIINFKQGIPGFEKETQFVILELFEGTLFKVLQSIHESYVAFIMCDPWMFEADYEFDLKESVIEELQILSSDDLSIYNFLTISQDMSQSTINLLAPIVVHQKYKIGMQVVLEGTKYTTKHAIRIEE